jgi:hypothetical protein
MITINGINISGSRSVVITNGRVVVDGKDVTPDGKQINIVVNGNLHEVRADACDKITVSGDAGNVSTVSGRVEVGGSIKGSVQTVSGAVRSGSIEGSVSTTSGDIDCGGTIGGNASSMTGDVTHR